MKVVGDFNKISKEMKAMMPKLEKGQVKTFQLVVGVRNNDPDQKEREKHPMLYANWQIPTKGRIRDWHTGEFVDIGVPLTIQKGEVLDTKVLMPGRGEPQFRYIGKWSLSGDKATDVEMYEFLCMSNENLSNVHRDTEEPAMFCELNIVKDTEEKLSKSDALLEAMNAAKNMPLEKMKEFASANLWGEFTDDKLLIGKVRQYAEDHPTDFNKRYKDPNTKVKAELSNAFDADIILFDYLNSTVKMGETVIATLDIREGSNYIEAFFEYTNSAPNGKEVLKSIRDQLKSAKKEKV